ncbi:MAG: DNA mismatch repair endonuclease MutL [Victivallales bacterium]|nr:DNA mismatch repair endonuclease MutL [Victivallales bacterium]
MGNIHIMSADVVGRIAAGEVVERPASVLKELVENSIDAGATTIRINIEQGGHKLVQVIDNGCGMDRSDALLCLETHATSKITDGGDVGRISTLGFRGEAIPSIASVSRFNLQTRRREDEVGTEVVVDFGKIRDAQDCGCAPGTNIRVAQLFGNMPARRKFLKGPDTEDGYIEEMVRLLALARPDITMVLCLNGRETIRANATSDIGQRVAAVLGRDMFASMIPLNYTEQGISVRGFVTLPGFTRSSRRDQRVIINGRAASADTIFFAIRDSYESLIMKGRYPGAVLYLEMPPDMVDVNVHPTKREVRFREARLVGQVVSAAIRRALRQMPGGVDVASIPGVQPLGTALPQNDAIARCANGLPAEDFSKASGDLDKNGGEGADGKPAGQPVSTVQGDAQSLEGENARPVSAISPVPPPAVASPPPIQLGLDLHLPPTSGKTPPVISPAQEHENGDSGIHSSPVRSTLRNIRLIGRLGARYAIAECETGLVLVNLRAAHQRILFEKMLADMNKRGISQQQLLIPPTLSLGADDARFLKAEQERFRQLGFQIEPFGGTTFIVSAVPAGFDNQNIAEMVRDIIDDLRRSSVTSRQSAIHLAQTACRYAVSAKTNLSDEEIKALMEGLAQCEMPYSCPNGHPTMVHITYAELEKRFQL